MSSQLITSADSVFVITVASLLQAPITLQNFAADRAWETAELEMAETEMSIDGYLNAGWVPNPVDQTISFSAASESVIIFEAIMAAQRTSYTLYRLNGLITIPSTSRKYTLSNGILRSASAVPSAGRMLESRHFGIRWESVIPAGV